MAIIDIYCHSSRIHAPQRHRSLAVSSTLNIQLTEALRKYVDERASDKDVYATPSEYIRDLIRQDMQNRGVAVNIFEDPGSTGREKRGKKLK
jgi:hypothetical protein